VHLRSGDTISQNEVQDEFYPILVSMDYFRLISGEIMFSKRVREKNDG
jgi:hypothetical protein